MYRLTYDFQIKDDYSFWFSTEAIFCLLDHDNMGKLIAFFCFYFVVVVDKLLSNMWKLSGVYLIVCSIWQEYFIPELWPFMCIMASLGLSLELAVLTFSLQNGVHRSKLNISLGTMVMPVELSKFQIGFDLWISQLVYSSNSS